MAGCKVQIIAGDWARQGCWCLAVATLLIGPVSDGFEGCVLCVSTAELAWSNFSCKSNLAARIMFGKAIIVFSLPGTFFRRQSRWVRLS